MIAVANAITFVTLTDGIIDWDRIRTGLVAHVIVIGTLTHFLSSRTRHANASRKRSTAGPWCATPSTSGVFYI